MKYMETYARARIPHRKITTNIKEGLIELEFWKKFTDISISPWYFREIEQKYDSFGKPTRYGPVYNSAIINSLFFDIDCYDNSGIFIEKNYQGMLNLVNNALDNNYKFDVAFTSGGYQMTIGVDSILPSQYKNIILTMAKECNAIIDTNISLANLRRVIGSYNFGKDSKSARNTYCISLKKDEIFLPVYRHIELAKKPRDILYQYGNNKYKPKNISKITNDIIPLDHRSDFTIDSSVQDILAKYGYYYNDICGNIRNIIEQPHVGHFQRIFIIRYLKDILHIKYGDMLILLPKLLTSIHGSETDGLHSINEGQVSSVYSDKYLFKPQQEYCSCTECSKYLAEIRRIARL